MERLQSNNPKEISTAIDELLKDPGDRKTLVIDPMTAVYDQMIKHKEELMKIRTGNLNYEIQPLDYKSIKGEIKSLMTKLLSLDMNVIVTARSKTLYSKGKFMEEIGEQADGHKDLPYMFDVVLRLYVNEAGERRAAVEKDRTNKLPIDFPFNYDSFVTYLGQEFLERPANKETQKFNLEARTGRTTKTVLGGETLITAGITGGTIQEIEELTTDMNEEDILDLLRQNFETNSFLDLTEKAGQTLLFHLRKLKNEENSDNK
jgi:hypothetical protein